MIFQHQAFPLYTIFLHFHSDLHFHPDPQFHLDLYFHPNPQFHPNLHFHPILTFPFSCSLLARMHSTRLRRSLQDMVCILLGRDSSWTFLENRLTAMDSSFRGSACLTWCTRSASVLYARGLKLHA